MASSEPPSKDDIVTNPQSPTSTGTVLDSGSKVAASPASFDYRNLKFVWPSWREVIAGSSAGVALTLVGHPFDTIKVRMQTQDIVKSTTGGKKKPFKGGIDCAMRTLQREGVRGLYKGMSGPLATVPLLNAVVFAAYQQGVNALKGPTAREMALWELALAGTWAGFVNSFIVGPVELVKSRLQVRYETGAKAGPWDVIRELVRTRGIRGLFLGMNITILRELPAYCSQFYSYEALKRMLANNSGVPQAELGPGALMFAGALAGVNAWVFSYPQDVLKSKIQVDPTIYGGRSAWWSCAKMIWSLQGARGFWVGFGPCLARALPANAAGFLCYEYTCRLLDSLEEASSGHSG